jgi:hypothetical protein
MADGGGTSDFAHDRALLKRIFDPPVEDHIQWFIDSAQVRLPVAEREQDEKLRFELLEMIRQAKTALESFKAGEIGRMLVAIGWMHEHRCNCGLNFQWAEARKDLSGKGGKASKRGREALWILLSAIGDEIGSHDQKAVRQKWEQFRSEDSQGRGVFYEHNTWFDGELYHFELDGMHTATRKQIQDTLSKIRNKKD